MKSWQELRQEIKYLSRKNELGGTIFYFFIWLIINYLLIKLIKYFKRNILWWPRGILRTIGMINEKLKGNIDNLKENIKEIEIIIITELEYSKRLEWYLSKRDLIEKIKFEIWPKTEQKIKKCCKKQRERIQNLYNKKQKTTSYLWRPVVCTKGQHNTRKY